MKTRTHQRAGSFAPCKQRVFADTTPHDREASKFTLNSPSAPHLWGRQFPTVYSGDTHDCVAILCIAILCKDPRSRHVGACSGRSGTSYLPSVIMSWTNFMWTKPNFLSRVPVFTILKSTGSIQYRRRASFPMILGLGNRGRGLAAVRAEYGAL